MQLYIFSKLSKVSSLVMTVLYDESFVFHLEGREGECCAYVVTIRSVRSLLALHDLGLLSLRCIAKDAGPMLSLFAERIPACDYGLCRRATLFRAMMR